MARPGGILPAIVLCAARSAGLPEGIVVQFPHVFVGRHQRKQSPQFTVFLRDPPMTGNLGTGAASGQSAGRGLCLVCSAGGHFMQLHSLGEVWRSGPRVWVTLPAADTQSLLKEERVRWAFGPTNRNVVNFFRNLRLAFSVLRRERPAAVLSTGAGVGVPFVWAARLLGIRTIFIEDMTRVTGLSLSGKLVYYVADLFLVQWPELATRYRRAQFRGRFL